MKINELRFDEETTENSIFAWLCLDGVIKTHVVIDKKTGNMLKIGDEIMRPNILRDAS